MYIIAIVCSENKLRVLEAQRKVYCKFKPKEQLTVEEFIPICMKCKYHSEGILRVEKEEIDGYV